MVHTIQSTQFIPASLEETWKFFSSPLNLQRITPASMHFQIKNGAPAEMFAGQIIVYKISPFPGLRLSWVTEITHVSDMKYFVDEQRFGPYKFWHHRHLFEAVPGGVRMQDVVHYALPLGILSRPFLPLVRRKLDAIFRFREEAVKNLFPA